MPGRQYCSWVRACVVLGNHSRQLCSSLFPCWVSPLDTIKLAEPNLQSQRVFSVRPGTSHYVLLRALCSSEDWRCHNADYAQPSPARHAMNTMEHTASQDEQTLTNIIGSFVL
jgi:hypothetical protein